MGKTNTAENALLQFEAGQTLVPFEEFADDGDHLNYSGTPTIFSGKSGFTPDVKPNGLDTGGAVTPEVGLTNDQVDIAASSSYLAGVQTPVGAAAASAVTRATTVDFFIVNSIQITAGGAYSVIAGVEAAALTGLRGAGAGAIPFILVDSIEIAQVILEGNVAAPISADEIFDVVGQHKERYDFPVWEENMAEAKVVFQTALPLSHTGDVTKEVHVRSYEPIFVDISLASDFAPPEVTHSVGSTQVYRDTIGSVSQSLGAGAFTAFLKDGITDALMNEKDENIWFKFFPDENKTPYILALGKLGIARTYPAGDSIQAACTVSSSEEGVGFAS